MTRRPAALAALAALGLIACGKYGPPQRAPLAQVAPARAEPEAEAPDPDTAPPDRDSGSAVRQEEP